MDDWSHPYHGPDNNPQSKDQVALAPYLTQFLAEPRYAPLPQVTVGSAGRVFKGFGHVAFKPREEAYLNTLVAFNGYNGTILWKRDLIAGHHGRPQHDDRHRPPRCTWAMTSRAS